MAEERVQRRLAAILAADLAGYSRLMEADEVGTLAALKEQRKKTLEPLVAQYQVRIFKIAGDAVLIEFASPVIHASALLARPEARGERLAHLAFPFIGTALRSLGPGAGTGGSRHA